MKRPHRLCLRSTALLALTAVAFLAAALPLFAAAEERTAIVFADFEGADYGGWQATGEAFGSGPARGTLPGQMPVSGFEGQGLVNSFLGGDVAEGTLTSPEFTIERRYIGFLIGGGGHEGKTAMNLEVEGKVVRSATGPNTAPGGSEALQLGAWDVQEFAGKKARLVIVDRHRGGWGHINVDQIVFTDQRPAGLLQRNPERRFTLEKRYLNLPVKPASAKRRMSVIVDGETVREFEIHLADGEPEFWVVCDVAAFKGKEAIVRVDVLPEESRALAMVEQGDAIKGSENLYAEALRPQIHFSSKRGWLNDPNGLVYYQGEYHLYYQHNPYGWSWDNMHWGHAVSRDLVHWEELPAAIFPKRFGDWAFSGSAVVDEKNTSGFQKGSEPVLVGAYTSTGRGECIIYSNDRGRMWQEYEGNPVVKHKGRDPRLLWYAPGKHWVMALYSEAEGKRWITFHTSPDLKTWTYTSRIEGFYECPDLVELPIDGDQANRKWLLYGANHDYLIGSFDGRVFTPETEMIKGPPGEVMYAAQTISNIPEEDGRCIQAGWGRMPSPGMPFNQMMTFPTVLALRTTPEGLRLTWQPVAEIEKLQGERTTSKDQALGSEAVKLGGGSEFLRVRAELVPGQGGKVELIVRGVPIVYDPATNEISCRGKKAVVPVKGYALELEVLSDRTSLEIFAAGGLVYIPIAVIPEKDQLDVTARAEGQGAMIRQADIWTLRSIWR